MEAEGEQRENEGEGRRTGEKGEGGREKREKREGRQPEGERGREKREKREGAELLVKVRGTLLSYESFLVQVQSSKLYKLNWITFAWLLLSVRADSVLDKSVIMIYVYLSQCYH